MFVVLALFMAIIDTVGFLHYWGVTISGTSTIYILVSVGLAVDYSAHIAHMFKVRRGGGREEAFITVSYYFFIAVSYCMCCVLYTLCAVCTGVCTIANKRRFLFSPSSSSRTLKTFSTDSTSSSSSWSLMKTSPPWSTPLLNAT